MLDFLRFYPALRIARLGGDTRRIGSAADEATEKYWRGRLRIEDIIREADAIKTFRLAAPGGSTPFKFLAGQYVDIELEFDGKPVHRSYSISSSAAERRFIDLTIKRKPQGLVSGYLCDRARVGDMLDIRGPFGRFTFSSDKARRVALVGAGVGVTPLVGIIRTLTDQNWRGEINAVFGFRRESDGLFIDELLERQKTNSGLRLTTTWSAPESRSTKPKGRINAALVRKNVSKLKEMDIFLCGPTEMMEQVSQGLVKAGVRKNRIRVEAFAPPPRDLSKGGAFQITFQKSGVQAMSEPGESLLETAERVGVEFDYSCRAGTCGLCEAKLVSGEVDLLIDDALDEEDIEKGIILTCQSFPRSDCMIL